jgi:SRSO17 transposase
LKGKAITVVIDETGDRKRGKKTNYVARQYLGSTGKIDNWDSDSQCLWSLL